MSGHAAGLTGPALQGYLAAGITSDHEIFTEPDCLEKLRAGMTVELRGALDAILPSIVEEVNRLPIPPTHLVAATDDLFALTLLEDGGLDHLLRRLIAHGMDPVLAFRCATYHAAYRLQRVDLGAVVAGRQADVIVLDSLDDVAVERGVRGRHGSSPPAAACSTAWSTARATGRSTRCTSRRWSPTTSGCASTHPTASTGCA